MPIYLDPKADPVFKRIFGEHPELLKSFLNAVLPLPPDGLIESLSYLPSEQVPCIPLFKNSIVDVKCTDKNGRVFIVEMQMQWTTSFMSRMLFQTSKAYVRQLQKGEDYDLLEPVYGLGLIAGIFEPENPEWYHHYSLVNVVDVQKRIEGLQLIFIELPKFKPSTRPEKKLQNLWLRFLSELKDEARTVPEEWLAVPEIKTALKLSEEAAFNPVELEAYDRYWDAVSVERTYIGDAKRKFLAQGAHSTVEALKLMKQGWDDELIAQETSLELALVQSLRQEL